MKLSQNIPGQWEARRAATWLFFLAVSILSGGTAVVGQQTDTGPFTTPQVPLKESRPAISDLERRDLTTRGADTGSMASLLQGVASDDGTLEVIVGRSRIITFQEPLAKSDSANVPVVAVGDPTVVEFDILGGGRMARILGTRVGFTDFSVVTQEGNAYNFEIRVVYDLRYLNLYLKQLFPNAEVRVHQMYEHVVVEGEASSTDQATKIVQTVQSFLASAQTPREISSESKEDAPPARGGREGGEGSDEGGDGSGGSGDDGGQIPPLFAGGEDKPDISATLVQPQVMNLIRVPGVQQIMLQVKIAEVNRTALRRMGTSWIYQDSKGRSFGNIIGSSTPDNSDDALLGLALGQATTSFAVLPNTRLNAAFDALRSNSVINVLAEPNLMAMHGQKASFLAGGEFPVPVPQASGNTNNITIQFKEFGVLLDFVPYIMDDGSVRLHVAPEVSTIDQAIGVVSSGIQVPGVSTRRANTTVELRQGQTLALAGLMQAELDANTDRLPGMGDLPYIGKFFSNNSHQRVEKELVILVSPYFASGLEPEQVGPLPGCEIRDPDDHEFYRLNRIESRHPGVDYRATNGWNDPLNIRKLKSGQPARPQYHGPYGFSQ